MEIKKRLKRQLLQARQLSEKLLADFKTPAQWVYQVHENCNHALWFAGHMAHVDNFPYILGGAYPSDFSAEALQ